MAYRILNAESVWQGDDKSLREFVSALICDCESRYDIFLSAYGWKRESIDLAIYRARYIIAGKIISMKFDVLELCENMETRARGNALREIMERTQDVLFNITRPSFS